MPTDSHSFRTQRTLAAPPARVYAAFANPDELAAWWGPEGFHNEFEVCEFRPGGLWKFVMVGPDGARHANTNRFVELLPAQRLVIEHESAPRFRLTVELAASEGGTLLRWDQRFEDAAVAAAVKHIVEPANEQNLDRMEAVLAAVPDAG